MLHIYTMKIMSGYVIEEIRDIIYDKTMGTNPGGY